MKASWLIWQLTWRSALRILLLGALVGVTLGFAIGILVGLLISTITIRLFLPLRDMPRYLRVVRRSGTLLGGAGTFVGMLVIIQVLFGLRLYRESIYVSIATTSCAVFRLISNQASSHDIVCSFDGIPVVAHEPSPQS
jgi:hypothetical protein